MELSLAFKSMWCYCLNSKGWGVYVVLLSELPRVGHYWSEPPCPVVLSVVITWCLLQLLCLTVTVCLQFCQCLSYIIEHCDTNFQAYFVSCSVCQPLSLWRFFLFACLFLICIILAVLELLPCPVAVFDKVYFV